MKMKLVKAITPPIATRGITGFPAINFIKYPKGVLRYPAWTFFCLLRISTDPNTIEAMNAEAINMTTPGKLAIGPNLLGSMLRSKFGLMTCKILKKSKRTIMGTNKSRINQGKTLRNQSELFSKNLLNLPDTPPKIGK